MIKKSHKRSVERVLLKLELVSGRAGLFAADEFSKASMQRRKFHIGDELSAELRKARNPMYFRTAHALGSMVADNIEQFSGMESHSVLKRLQWEANIGCDEMGVQVPGVGLAMVRYPKSLSFESMDEGEFSTVMRDFCRHISKNYWHDLDEFQIEEMVGLMDKVA